MEGKGSVWLNKMDKAIDAMKDAIILVVANIVSFFAFLSGQPVGIMLANLILLVSIITTSFLAYKFAVIRDDVRGAHERTRAILLIINLISGSLLLFVILLVFPETGAAVANEVLTGDIQTISFLMKSMILVLIFNTFVLEPLITPRLLRSFNAAGEHSDDVISGPFRIALSTVILSSAFLAFVLVTAGAALHDTEFYDPRLYVVSLAYSLLLIVLAPSFALFEPLQVKKQSNRTLLNIFFTLCCFIALYVSLLEQYLITILVAVLIITCVAYTWTKPAQNLTTNIAMAAIDHDESLKLLKKLANRPGRLGLVFRWAVRALFASILTTIIAWFFETDGGVYLFSFYISLIISLVLFLYIVVARNAST